MKIPAAKIIFSEEDRKQILQKIEESLVTGMLTLGKNVKAFEEEFARLTGSKYAVAVSSGTSALEIVLRALKVKNKEVLVPTNTFFATAAAVIHAGGTPQFVDADWNTFSIDVNDLKRRINKQTAGLIVTHVGGIITPMMENIQAICQKGNLFLIEDAAHAHGCSYRSKMAGTFGKAAAFSFYPTKVMTSGEGGMIVTDDEKIAEEARIYRDQGKAGFYSNYHVRMGYNWRMSECHAAVGLVHLRRIHEFIQSRQKAARIYDQELKNITRIKPCTPPQGCSCNYYKYIVLLDGTIERKELKKILKEKYEVNLSGEVYEDPLHVQPVFEQYRIGDYPVADDICRRHICLPIYPEMKEEEAHYVIESLKGAIKDFDLRRRL